MTNLRVAHACRSNTLPILREISHETIQLLLDRAAEVGLLTAHGNGYYTIHPASTLFLRDHFTRSYPAGGLTDNQDGSKGAIVGKQSVTRKDENYAAVRAHALAMSAVSDYYCGQYQEGDRNFITALHGDEANLLQARKASLKYGWWRPLTGIMRGLLVLYEGTSRMSEWIVLVEEILPIFIDPTTGSPLPGFEEHWDTVTGLRARAAMAKRSFDEAEKLQRLLVEHERKAAAVALASPTDKLGPRERAGIRWLVDRLNQLGNVLLARRDPECLTVFQEDYDLSHVPNDRALAANSAFNLGHGFLLFSEHRDLRKAEAWYRHSLKLRARHDWLGRAKCLNQLGLVALEHFQDAKIARKPNAELLRLLNRAANFHKQALDVLPRHAVPDLAIAYGQLGNIYIEAGDVTSALRHWQNAIRAFEWAQDFHAAGQTRRNIALGLARSGRFNDALVYARAALENYRTYGDHAADEIKEVYELIASIQKEAGNWISGAQRLLI